MGVPFAFILGIIAGITELVPVVGPWIGAIAGILVTLATEPHLLPWVVLLYLGVQLLENTLLVPRIQGDSLNLHPAAIISDHRHCQQLLRPVGCNHRAAPGGDCSRRCLSGSSASGTDPAAVPAPDAPDSDSGGEEPPQTEKPVD